MTVRVEGKGRRADGSLQDDNANNKGLKGGRRRPGAAYSGIEEFPIGVEFPNQGFLFFPEEIFDLLFLSLIHI